MLVAATPMRIFAADAEENCSVHRSRINLPLANTDCALEYYIRQAQGSMGAEANDNFYWCDDYRCCCFWNAGNKMKEEVYLELREREDAKWDSYNQQRARFIDGWDLYIGALSKAYPDRHFFRSAPISFTFRRGRVILIRVSDNGNIYPEFKPNNPPVHENISKAALRLGMTDAFPKINPKDFDAECFS